MILETIKYTFMLKYIKRQKISFLVNNLLPILVINSNNFYINKIK